MILSPVGSALETSLPSGPGYTHRLVARGPAEAPNRLAAASAARSARHGIERREQGTVMTPENGNGPQPIRSWSGSAC
jgi:hypothetical protein